jgi:hypothetical protein
MKIAHLLAGLSLAVVSVGCAAEAAPEPDPSPAPTIQAPTVAPQSTSPIGCCVTDSAKIPNLTKAQCVQYNGTWSSGDCSS